MKIILILGNALCLGWIFGHLSTQYPIVVILCFSLRKASYAEALRVRNALCLLEVHFECHNT